MSNTQTMEIQDASGTVYHPFTEADVVLVNNANLSATTVNDALTEITTADVRKSILTATITASKYSTTAPYSQTITVTGVLSTDQLLISPVLSSTLATAIAQKSAWNSVSRIVPANGSITVYCYDTKPTTDVSITICRLYTK